MNYHVKHWLPLLAIAASTSNVLAQKNPEFVVQANDRVIYETPYFTRYAPQTATDMVLQIPGFTLIGSDRDGGGSQERGLGQGDGNLLIDGKRPSTKNNNAVDLLDRIAAKNVIRLEILNNGSAELAGQSGQIVNVVVAESDKISGSWSAGVHESERGYTEPRFEVSLSSKLNNISYSAGLELFGNEYPQWGAEQAFDENSTLFEIRDEYQSFAEEIAKGNLSLAWDNEQGDVANFSFVGTLFESDFTEESDRYSPDADSSFGQLLTNIDFSAKEDEFNYELGGDYATELGVGVLKIIALRRFEESDETSLFQDLQVDGMKYLFQGDSLALETEHVLRTLYTITPKDQHSWEFALELVDNELDNSADYLEDTGNGFAPLDVGGSDVVVSEERAEFSMQYSRPVSQDWTFQGLLAGEYSEISVKGDVKARSEDFTRFKGFASISGPITDKLRLRARLERSVGQLSFFDFASSQNANEGTTRGGNTQLVPDQTWRAELGIEYKFSDADVVTITGFSERVDDFVTFIPFEGGGEGRGNIDGFSNQGIDISATIATDRLGVPGGKFDISAEFHDNELADPVTGEKREYRRDGYRPVDYQIDFRQDIPGTAIAWGGSLIERSGNIYYRKNRITYDDHLFPQAHILFVEHKDIAGMTVKLEIEDFTNFTYIGRREFYEADRNGRLIGVEQKRRHSPWVARLAVSGTF